MQMKIKSIVSMVPTITGVFAFAAVLGCANVSQAQAPGVPVYTEDSFSNDQVMSAAEKLHKAGKLIVSEATLTNQLLERKSCELKLASPRTEKLAGRDLWAVARAAHLRVGWYYRTPKSDEWLITTAAGYALTTDGAVATCYHVARPPESMSEGFLFAVNESGQAYPITEILAGDAAADTCILQVAAHDLKPLALNTN